MGKLIGYIVAGFSTLIPALIAFFGRKAVVAAASLAAFAALTVAFLFVMKSLVDSIALSLVVPVWLQMIAWFVPTNFLVVFSAIISAHISRAAFDLAVAKIKMVNSAS